MRAGGGSRRRRPIRLRPLTMRAGGGSRRRRPIRLRPLTMRAGRYPSGTPTARSRAAGQGRRRRAWPAAGRACATAGRRPPPARCPRGAPCAPRTAPASGTTTARLRNPSPMPSTRPRAVEPVTRSVMPCKSARSRKPLRGNAATVPDDTVQPGAANSRVRRPTCSRTRSAPISRRLASCAGSVANSPRRLLVAASSKPCSTTASPAGAAVAQPVDGAGIVLQPVAVLEPGRHRAATPARRGCRAPGRTRRYRRSVRSQIPDTETMSCPATSAV